MKTDPEIPDHENVLLKWYNETSFKYFRYDASIKHNGTKESCIEKVSSRKKIHFPIHVFKIDFINQAWTF